MKKGCKYGTHRVIEPQGVLPQAAQKIDNDMDIYSNEVLIDVIALNIDSASFHQIKEANNADPDKMGEMITSIVSERGKMQNPVTGSGGMLIGRVKQVGDEYPGDLKVGDKIATLVSLSLTPLKIDQIKQIHMDIDKVEIDGTAILFESGIYAKLPDDMTEALALAALDVAGAPAQAAKLAQPGQSILILGASGKSGIMCAYEARKRVGPTGRVVGMASREETAEKVRQTGFCHEVIVADAGKPMEVLEKALAANNGEEYDLAINVVNIPNTEMSTILPVRNGGIVYFFSMATSFTKAALGAEGVGKDVTMIIGNGYTKDHAEITLEVLRESDILRELFENSYQ
ncbi:MAG TPA: L-erythro-3,5-diaminohexanoate dehydrogenase [Tissierellia bacterium]|nr:L-erythro-3,5-diaminohexanoate dehydrogenase [Tissierellia bacterium]